MILKLITYDIKKTSKILVPFLIILLLSTTLTLGLRFLTQYIPFIQFIETSMNAITTFASIILLPGVMMISCYLYYKNILKDEGYLMHTLPVSKTQLYLSKIIVSSLASIIAISFVFIIARVLNPDFLLAMATSFQETFNLSPMIGLVLLVIFMLIVLLYNIALINLSLTLGHTHTYQKLTYSFLYYIGFYFISQVINLIILAIGALSIVNFNFSLLFSQEIISKLDNLAIYLIMTIIIEMIFLMIVFITVNIKTLSNRLNLE